MPRTTLFSILRRQWRVWLPVLLLVTGIAAVLESRSPTYHEATGTVLLAESEPGRWASAGAAVSTISIVERVTSSDVATAVEERGDAFGAYRVDERTFQLYITGEQETDVDQAREDALDWLVRDIDEHQANAGVPPDQRVSVQPRFLDPVTWQLADGRYATGAEVTLHDTSGADNPYGASNATWRLLQIAASSDRGQAVLREQMAADTDFTISVDPRDEAPVATIDVGASDEAAALAAFDTVTAFLADELEARQRRAGVAAERRHAIEVIGRPTAAERTDSVPSGPAGLTLVLGGTAAIALAAIADWMARGRRRRDQTAPLVGEHSPDPGPGSPLEADEGQPLRR